MKRHNKSVSPLLVGTVTNIGTEQNPIKQIKVWCPFCKVHHIHSWPNDAKDNDAEHRANHCTSENSPFLKTGYYISVEPVAK